MVSLQPTTLLGTAGFDLETLLRSSRLIRPLSSAAMTSCSPAFMPGDAWMHLANRRAYNCRMHASLYEIRRAVQLGTMSLFVVVFGP